MPPFTKESMDVNEVRLEYEKVSVCQLTVDH